MTLFQPSFSETPKWNETIFRQFEIKTLPVTTALTARFEGNYFEGETSSGVFKVLFDYIKANHIKMTTPVLVYPDEHKMQFLVSAKQSAEIASGKHAPLESTALVSIETLPETKVMAYGIQGTYTQERYQEGRSKLLSHLNGLKQWKTAGKEVIAFWSSPFTPPPLKHADVMVPIESVVEAR